MFFLIRGELGLATGAREVSCFCSFKNNQEFFHKLTLIALASVYYLASQAQYHLQAYLQSWLPFCATYKIPHPDSGSYNFSNMDSLSVSCLSTDGLVLEIKFALHAFQSKLFTWSAKTTEGGCLVSDTSNGYPLSFLEVRGQTMAKLVF